MASEIRIIVLIMAVLALAAWAARSWACAPPPHRAVMQHAQLQTAAVSRLAGASMRAVSGF